MLKRELLGHSSLLAAVQSLRGSKSSIEALLGHNELNNSKTRLPLSPPKIIKATRTQVARVWKEVDSTKEASR